jgi:hypothetical protein
MDQTFVYTGTGQAIYGNPFVVKDSWPARSKELWIAALSSSGYLLQAPPFVPTYEQGLTVTYPNDQGGMTVLPLNQLEFPTLGTCQILAKMYAVTVNGNLSPLVVLEIPFTSAGPDYSPAMIRLLQFPNFNTLPAWQLADYWTNSAVDADQMCKLLIARVYPSPVTGIDKAMKDAASGVIVGRMYSKFQNVQ